MRSGLEIRTVRSPTASSTAGTAAAMSGSYWTIRRPGHSTGTTAAATWIRLSPSVPARPLCTTGDEADQPQREHDERRDPERVESEAKAAEEQGDEQDD